MQDARESLKQQFRVQPRRTLRGVARIGFAITGIATISTGLRRLNVSPIVSAIYGLHQGTAILG